MFKIFFTILRYVLGFTKDHTTVILALAASTANTGSHNHITLLGLVAQTVSLVRTGRTVAGQNVRALTVFPRAAVNTEQRVGRCVRILPSIIG
jgi:hypothetical protein